MSNSNKTMKRRALISMYKKLLKSNRIKQFGPAYHRMKELEQKHLQQTRWFGVRYRNEASKSNSLGLATKDLN